MDRALRVAERGLGLTSPNPAVGAVLVKDERVVGEGAHLRAGGPHAEIVALDAAGPAARGATCYVTLEPCAHVGRTGPCADALVRAGVARVVAAVGDPHHVVDGRGLARLRAAGVDVAMGVREAEARRLNRGFFCVMTEGRPHVTLKTAMTLDGKIAAVDGVSQWITGKAARLEAHRLRFVADAIVVGIGTVLTDDPQLSVRHPGLPPKEPLRVVVDSRLEMDERAKVLPALVFSAVEAKKLPNAQIVRLANPNGKVDLPGMLKELAQRGVNELHVEAGFKLNGSLVREGCVDEFLIYLNPSLLGDSAQGMADISGVKALDERVKLKIRSVESVGGDIRVVARL